MSKDTIKTVSPNSPSHDLTQRPIPQVIRQIALPAALGMLYTTLFNLVDVYFAGWIGTEAQAGLSLGFQAYSVLMAFGFGLAAAMGALVGQKIGENDNAGAAGVAFQGITFGLIIAFALMLLGTVGGTALIHAISEAGEYQNAALNYFNLLLLSAPGFILAYGCNGILQAQGDSKSLQYAMLGAAIFKCALTPLCIYGVPAISPGLGFAGFAVSSIIAWTGVLGFMLWRVLRSPISGFYDRKMFLPHPVRLRLIARYTFPAASSFVVLFLSGFIAQYALKGFGPHGIAAYGIAIRIEQILFLPLQALSLALLPVASQNLGAGDFARARAAFFYTIRIGSLLAIIAAVILWSLGDWAMRLFSDQEDVVRVGLSYLRIDSLVLPFYMMAFAMNSMFQALGRPGWPLWIGLYRRGIGLAFFIWLFIGPLGFAEEGIWYGHVFALLTGWSLAVWALRRVSRSWLKSGR